MASAARRDGVRDLGARDEIDVDHCHRVKSFHDGSAWTWLREVRGAERAGDLGLRREVADVRRRVEVLVEAERQRGDGKIDVTKTWLPETATEKSWFGEVLCSNDGSVLVNGLEMMAPFAGPVDAEEAHVTDASVVLGLLAATGEP